MNKSSTMDAPEGAPQSVSAHHGEQQRHRLEKRRIFLTAGWDAATCDAHHSTWDIEQDELRKARLI